MTQIAFSSDFRSEGYESWISYIIEFKLNISLDLLLLVKCLQNNTSDCRVYLLF